MASLSPRASRSYLPCEPHPGGHQRYALLHGHCGWLALSPADMRDDEILVTDWLADDLRVQPGDCDRDDQLRRRNRAAKLVESTNRFRVRGVVPLSGIYADRTLMPDFPGIGTPRAPAIGMRGLRLT